MTHVCASCGCLCDRHGRHLGSDLAVVCSDPDPLPREEFDLHFRHVVDSILERRREGVV